MASDGVLLNALIMLFACIFYALVSVKAWSKRSGFEGAANVKLSIMLSSVVWSFITLATFFMSLRQLFAYFDLTFLDVSMFYATAVFLAFMVAPLTFLVSNLFLQNRMVSFTLSVFLFLVGFLSLVFLFQGGLEGPILSEWGSEILIVSDVTLLLFVFLLILPGILLSTILGVNGLKIENVAERNRVVLISFSWVLFFSTTLIDGFGVQGVEQVLIRLGFVLSALLAYYAYHIESDDDDSSQEALSQP